LTFVFNLSLSQGAFPDELKLAKVTPIYKADDSTILSNYRPVSVLRLFSKILEKLMLNRLSMFFEKYNILYPLQFRFRSRYSTSLAMIYLNDIINNSLSKGDSVIGILIDLSKAFDTVNHQILLDKLFKYGIRGIAHKWLSSYLTNRKQCVSYQNSTSPYFSITCGVPQGSILGPFLFLCYINDLPKISKVITPLIFADDTNLFLSGKDPNRLIEILNRELVKVRDWMMINKLSLNTTKTKYILFSKPKSHIHITTELKLNNEIISRVTSAKFLGIYIDEKLIWNIHISNICKKISKGIGIINKAKKSLNVPSLLTLYYSFLHPYITYGIEVWGKAYNMYLLSLFKLQKRAIRIIKSVNRMCESAPLFFDLKILDLYKVYQLHVLLFVFKYKNALLPPVFNTFFHYLEHSHNTRNRNLFRVPLFREAISQKVLRYQGVILSNSFNNKISSNLGYHTYKKKLKSYLLSNNINQ